MADRALQLLANQPSGGELRMTYRIVRTRAELVEAVTAAECDVEVEGGIDEAPPLKLAPGRALRGGAAAAIRFAAGGEGVQLTSDNHIEEIALLADPERQAIYNDTGAPGFGRLSIRGVRTQGVVRVLANEAAHGGHLAVEDLHIEMADARAYLPRPKGFGVEVIAGAFSLWNQQADPIMRLTADLVGLSAGRSGAPVLGGGVFVGGTPDGGQTIVSRLETGEIHSNGGIVEGAPGQITGGVFVLAGAWVHKVCNRGPVTTYGPNDMVLDNWGSVELWEALGKITSFGPSGIGFVNFGELGELSVDAEIETFGRGARGFNVYAGTVRKAVFDRVVTHADGAVGVQISQPIGTLHVRRGIETFGGVGDSLVKGVVMPLAAVPLSIKPGGSAKAITVEGGLLSHAKGVEALEMHGAVEEFSIRGGMSATAADFPKL